MVVCPQCGQRYEDWFRPSINLALDAFDAAYMDAATSATCPNCGHKVKFEILVVDEEGVFHFGT